MTNLSESENQPLFGTIKGVLIPNITMMFGVILFVRLGVIAAHSGAIQMLGVVSLSLFVMTLTSLSIGSLVTNMKVGSGGVYYIISRVLGVEVGGSVGLGIYFAQLMTIALTLSGFAISLHDVVPAWPVVWIEMISLVTLAVLSGYSASWALSLQGVILAVLMSAVASIFWGSAENLSPLTEGSYEPFYAGGSLSFWQAFALFYPAMTGIEAGMAMSGSLRNPARSLFLGNLYSLVFVALVYGGLALFAIAAVPHEVLLSDPFALVEFSVSSKLVRLAIWGATLSSALGSMLGAPRMLQSMAADGVITPWLAQANGEPRRALIVTTVLAGATILLTTIDQVIPMLAMVCLASYGLLNFLTGFSQLMNAPQWRPTMQTPWWVSFAACAIILLAMLMIAPGWSLATFVILIAVYVGIRARDVESGFQDLRDSFIFFISRLALYRLGTPTEHALTWHPQILVLLTAPTTSTKLVRLTHSLTRRSGLLTYATVVPEEWNSVERLQTTRDAFAKHFDRLRIACLTEVYPSESTLDGYLQLIRAFGIGPIQPNTVALEVGDGDVNERLIEVIDTCRLMQKNLLLLRDCEAITEAYLINRGLSRRKRIDVWWDREDTQAFDLTMSLVTTLSDGLAFNGATVTIKAEVPDPNAKKEVTEYLQDFLSLSRIGARVRVYAPGDKIGPPALLTFRTLDPLPEITDEALRAEEYQRYAQNLQAQLAKAREGELLALITCYDAIDHREIYLPSAESGGA